MARLSISGGKRLLPLQQSFPASIVRIPPKSIMVGSRVEIAGRPDVGLHYDVRYIGRTFPSSSFPVNLTTRITAFIFCVDVKNV